jgi:hypothetical protein
MMFQPPTSFLLLLERPQAMPIIRDIPPAIIRPRRRFLPNRPSQHPCPPDPLTIRAMRLGDKRVP